jgi:homogentisate 1,2-dioxygenase
MADYEYMNGFGNHFSSEALPDALPKGIIFCLYINLLMIIKRSEHTTEMPL